MTHHQLLRRSNWTLCLAILLLNLPILEAGRLPSPPALGTTTHNTEENAAETKPPPDSPDNILTDSNIAEAVQMWCEDSSRAILFYGPIREWNTSAVTNFRGLFRRQTNFNDDISQWDTSRATSMAAMFQEASSFDQDLSQWDTGNVISMSAMFADATSFTGAGSLHWNVEQVTRMDRMFENAILFQGDLSHWNIQSLHHVDHMFHNAINYQGGQDLALWDTRQFKDMSAMFQHAIRFNGNISLWDTSNVLEMDELFHNAISFNGDLSHWDTSSVVTMARMFRNATKFTGLGKDGGVENWNVENVTNFYGMFEDNPSFQADVSNWKPAKADNMERMFYNATAFGKQRPLKDTISSSIQQNSFSLLCWELPDGYFSTQDALCGSNVRFDPCCVSIVQFETACCHEYCDHMDTTCQYPDYHPGPTQAQYSVSTGNMVHENVDDEQDEEFHREQFDPKEEKEQETPIGWEGGLFIGVLLVLIVFCFSGLVKHC